MSEQEKKERLKELKDRRREFIQRATQTVKENNRAIKEIKKRLAEGPATVPEVAEATGMSARDVLWFISALKKYGQVAEGTKSRADSYYPYSLIAENEDAEESANG